MVGENAKPERDGRQDQVLARAQKTSKRPISKRIEQQESRDMRYRQSRRDFAGERQRMQRHPEHEQQDQAPQKFRNRQQQDRGEIGDRLQNRAAQTEQEQAAAKAEDAGDDHGGEGELDCRRQGRRDQRSGLAAKLDGLAEIAMKRAAEPDQNIAPAAADRGPSRGAWLRFPSIVAFGGSDIAAGSTGRARSTQNNSAETISRIGIAASRRRAISLMTVAIIWLRP